MAAIGGASAVVLLMGCGYIGEPLYPALRIPSKVTDLTVLEHGDNLEIDFNIPALTTEGVPLKEIGGVEVRVGPGMLKFNAEEWVKTATRAEVPTPKNPGPVRALVPVGNFAGQEVIVAVRVTNPKGRDAGWSDYKIFDVQTPLASPADFSAAASAQGVQLTWRASGPSQFRIFRKTEQQQKPVLLATATEPNYVDVSAEYGKAYQYSVQAVRDQLESDVVGPVSITPVDIFPPAVPAGFSVSSGLGTIELAWSRNTEPDFKEYRVLRSDDGGPFVEIARGLETPVFSDRNIQSGKRYRYQVLALDRDGHPSAPSDPVEITAP